MTENISTPFRRFFFIFFTTHIYALSIFDSKTYLILAIR